MALPLSLKGLLTQIRLKPLLGIHLLQAPVLVLELLEPLHHRGVHAAKPRAPLIERRTADAVLAAEVRDLDPGFSLLEHRHDLAVGES